MLSLRNVLVASILAGSFASVAPAQTILTASANDNRTSAGVLRNGVLSLHLEIRPAIWYPEEDGKAHLIVSTFAEQGQTPQIPGPMIRVPAGTEIAASIRNLLDHQIYIHGFRTRAETNTASQSPSSPAATNGAADALEIAAGAFREVRFKSGPPGSYYYWASNDHQSLLMRTGLDSMLSGALIVDAPGAHPDDRVFVMNTWLPNGGTAFNTLPTINGKSWPYTEHLDLHVADHVNWRWINTSDADHAMHMHGFYFRVNGIGDQDHFAAYKSAERPNVVTQEMPPGGTFDMTWVPERPGHWLMHCHFTIHMMIGDLPGYPISSAYTPENAGMAGLILGVNVLPTAKPASSAVASAQVHKLRLLVRERPGTARTFAGYSFDLARPGRETPVAELPPVGDPLVLTRGEPAEIEVINQLKEPTTVHWHGIELESPYDGVPGWSGSASQSVPPIAPGGSFVARMTPPRAGTFIYHSHWHEREQLGAGLTGPIIVLPPGEKYDPATDKTFLFTRDGTEGVEPLLLNGISQPAPIPLTVGTSYRLRFINITPVDSDLTYSIADSSGAPVQWRPIAKDGWDFAADQTSLRSAHEGYLSVGETRDYTFVPDKPGELYLRAVAFQRMWVSVTLIVSPRQP